MKTVTSLNKMVKLVLTRVGKVSKESTRLNFFPNFSYSTDYRRKDEKTREIIMNLLYFRHIAESTQFLIHIFFWKLDNKMYVPNEKNDTCLSL